MRRLCERPGCSEPASVAYGMRPEDLVFWLDVFDDAADTSSGVLCHRHADSMVVPRHWTLDDLREPRPRLFRPPVGSAVVPPPPPPPRGSRAKPQQRESFDINEQGDEPAIIAWTPTFDVSNDLDGLLSAKSPLLARAFRGDDRPREK